MHGMGINTKSNYKKKTTIHYQIKKTLFIVIGVSFLESKIVKSISLMKAVKMIVNICKTKKIKFNRVKQMNFLFSPSVTSDFLMYSACGTLVILLSIA